MIFGSFEITDDRYTNNYETINQFEVLLRCDYYEKGGVYPELKAIYRDMKIDLILSKWKREVIWLLFFMVTSSNRLIVLRL